MKGWNPPDRNGFPIGKACVLGIICLHIDSDDGRPGSPPGPSGFSGLLTQGLMTRKNSRLRLPPRPLRAKEFLLFLGIVALFPGERDPLAGQSLGGSSRSVERQFQVAREHDFTFLGSPAQVERFAKAGYLVPVRSNGDFELHGVSFPYARPETRTFVLRLSEQYRRACGEKLVVTSLTRPLSRQPRNASVKSVHPTGMAVDIRRSNNRACRTWLERVLVSLERAAVLEATLERRPPHYHVALFPKPYARYVANLTSRADMRLASASVLDYQVRRGDSLWDIAQAHNTTVNRLKEANDLRGSRIYAGQVLRVPVGR